MLTDPGRALLDTSLGGPLSASAERALEACGVAGWSDPTALTSEGRRASQLLSAAREPLARALGGTAERLTVAPGVATALTLALRGLTDGQRLAQVSGAVEPTLIVSAVDHPAILRFGRWWAQQGRHVIEVGVDRFGRFDAPQMIAAARDNPHSVVSVQLANGEIGTRQPAEEVLDALAGTSAATLLDATACIGRISIPAGASVTAGDAISWGGPRGVSILMNTPSSPWRNPHPIAEPEIAVALLVAAAAALESVLANRDVEAERARAQISLIRSTLPSVIDDVDVIGDPDDRLPHVLTVSVLYLDGESLVRQLDDMGVAVGSGSACANDSGQPSHVLAAIGGLTGGNVRVCLPLHCPDDHIQRFLEAFPEAVRILRPDLTTVKETMSDASTPEPDVWLDERSSRCPAPVIALGRAAFTREPGIVVAGLASDPAAATDIPAWCRLRGAEFLGTRPPPDGGDGVGYLVRLAAPTSS